MRGSVKKHGPTWRYRIDLDPEPLTGKRRQLTKAGFATKRAAQDACTEAMDKARRGELVRSSGATIGEFLEEWIVTRKVDMKPTAWRGYRDYLDSYVLPVVGSTRLQELNTIRLNLLYVNLLEHGRRKVNRDALMFAYYLAEQRAGREPTPRATAQAGGVTYDAARKALIRYRRGQRPRPETDGLSPKTVRNVHVMLHGALADAVRWNLLPRNPATDARPPRLPRRKHVIWTTEELRKFVEYARSDSYSALWMLVCTTGLRRSELAGLRRADVSVEYARITSGDTRVVVGGHATDSDGKSDDSRRTLALDPVTLEALREYLQQWDSWKADFGHSGQYLFCHPDGRPIHPDTITARFARLSWQAGLPPIRLHDVRHSYATAALQAGVPVKVVSERLGHSSVSFTQDTYMHVIPGMDAHGAALAAAAIFGAQAPGVSPDSPLV